MMSAHVCTDFSPKVFFSADYDGLELRTMAQACLLLVGKSKMADALNAGRDVHLELAATMLGISYAEAELRKKAGDSALDYARQTAKIANFGFAGGMGVDKFVLQARKQYKMVLTREFAVWLKQKWLETWPEFREYFERASVESAVEGGAVFAHYFSDRMRGGLSYTELNNTRFQGLGADATGNALWLVSRACYTLQPCIACAGASNGCARCRPCHGPGISCLYGSRLVNYVHDENIGECSEAWGHEVAHELGDFMVAGAAPYLPDVPATCKPQLMRFWSKLAEPVWVGVANDNGETYKRLVPWDYGMAFGKMSKILNKPEKWFPRKKAA